jgi:DNA replication and repair protein RecF
MAAIARLSIAGLRNLRQIEIEPASGINLIYGLNGAGKTSLLEALYMLSAGRSFRSHQVRPVISEAAPSLTLFGQTRQGDALGIEKNAQGHTIIRVNGKPAASLADLSYALPIQLINTDTLNILEGGPQERRRFLDWGVFHVEHGFLPAWRKARLALKQRNALLKSGAHEREIQPWSRALVQAAEEVELFRQTYLQELTTEFHSLLSGVENLPEALGGVKAISLDYRRGWNQETGLAQQLLDALDRDRRQGFTSIGPHRADILFKIAGKDLADLFSRGQLKLVVCLLKIAQAILLNKKAGKQSIFLVDDLPAELDAQNRAFICDQLCQLNSQIFMTAIEAEPLYSQLGQSGAWDTASGGLFHVKHGTISPYLPD